MANLPATAGISSVSKLNVNKNRIYVPGQASAKPTVTKLKVNAENYMKSPVQMPFCPSVYLVSMVLAIFMFAPFAFAQNEPKISLTRPLTQKWGFRTENTVGLAPAIGNGMIYLPMDKGLITALEHASGRLVWKSEMGGVATAPPVVDEYALYLSIRTLEDPKKVKNSAIGTLQAISPKTGLTLWLKTFNSEISGGAVFDHTDFLFIATKDGLIYRLNKLTGDIDWKRQLPANILSQPAMNGSKLYVGDEKGALHAFDVNTGETIWRYQTRSSFRVPVSFFNDAVFVASTDGHVHALAQTSGELFWRVRTGASVHSLVQTSSCVIATSFDNFAYCLSHDSGQKIWKYKFDGRVLAVPLVTRDAVLFAPISGDEFIVLETLKGRKVNSIPVGADNITSASPVIYDDLLFLTTRQGLFAYTEHVKTNSN